MCITLVSFILFVVHPKLFFIRFSIFASYSTCTKSILHLGLSFSHLPPSLSAPKIASFAVQGVKSALLVVVSELTLYFL